MRKMKAVYFDMGGVLMDVESRFTRHSAIAYSLDTPEIQSFLGADFNLDAYVNAISKEIKEKYYNVNTTEQPDAWITINRQTAQFLNRSIPYKIHHQIFWRYVQFMTDCFKLKPETKRILDYCQQKNYLLGLISNVFHPSIVYKELFSQWDIIHYFHPLIFSSDLYFRKPDPRIFLYALAFHPGLKPEHCYFIGDTYETDITGALSVGMVPLWLNSSTEKPNPDHVRTIQSLEELREIL